MRYEILDYRPSKAYGSMWTVDVKVVLVERFLFWDIRKATWMTCGKDGQPRFYNKIGNLFEPKNRLVIVDTRDQAEQKIREFKQSIICHQQKECV